MRRLLAVALLVLAGCQEAPTPRPGPPPPGSLTAQLRKEGDELLAQGHYEAAALKYQRALNQEGADLALRYGLGVAFSHLQRRHETIEQFRWIVERGAPDSTYVTLARNWLVDAGEPVGPPRPRPVPSPAADDSALKGTIKGTSEWPGHDPRSSGVALRIILTPLEGQKLGSRGNRRFWLGETFGFLNVPVGKYQLTATAGGVEYWNQEVIVEADRETVVALSSTNSRVPVDRVPQDS